MTWLPPKKTARPRRGGGVAAALALAFSGAFACAASDEAAAPQGPGPSPEASSAPSPPDASDGPSLPDSDAEPPARCSAGGFCPTPLPVDQPLLGVSAASADDAWAIGEDVLLHWDGTSWRLVHTTANADLVEVWARKKDDVWAIGADHIVRYSSRDGGPPSIRDIPVDVPLTTFFGQSSFWVTPEADALWVVANFGVQRLHEGDDGTMIAESFYPAAGYYWFSVGGFGPDDVYVGGSSCFTTTCNDSVLAHYDGSAWSIQEIDPIYRVTGIYGTTLPSEPRQIWVRSQQRLFPAFVAAPEPIRLYARTDAGLGPALFTQPLMSDLNPVYQGCKSISASALSPAAAWFTNGCLVYRWNGTSLDVIPTAQSGRPLGRVRGLWAESADDAWIVGEAAPAHGTSWRTGFAAQRKGGRP